MRSRIIAPAAVATALIATLVGCTPGGGDAGGTGGATGSQVNPVVTAADCTNEIKKADVPLVSVWAWYPNIATVVDNFNEGHDDVQVCWNNVGQGGEEYDKVQTAISAGKGLPDVVMLEADHISAYAIQNALVNLGDYGVDSIRSSFSDGAWKDVSQGDSIFGVPVDGGPMALIYRTDVFDKYGVTAPKTWDDFRTEFISCHAYYEEKKGDTASFLASAVDMDHFIESVVATADGVRAAVGSTKRIDISFDEWNVWYIDRYHADDKITDIEKWPVAPRLLEDVYSVKDAVVFGSLMISLLKHADRVKSASLAQLVNVIAPIMTEPGGDAWRQTTFFPFAVTSRLAVGDVLRLSIESETISTEVYGDVPTVDAVATFDGETGRSAVFLVNRSMTESVTVTVGLGGLDSTEILESVSLWDDDLMAANTLDDQERVALKPNDSASIADGTLTVTLPPVSWTALSLA